MLRKKTYSSTKYRHFSSNVNSFQNIVSHREKLWQEFQSKKNNDQLVKSLNLEVNGSSLKVESNQTPIELGKKLDKSWKKKCVGAQVTLQNDENFLIDSFVSIPENVKKLKLLSLDSNEGKQIYWHSAAHVLGLSMEQYLGVDNGYFIELADGPALEEGFFYEGKINDHAINSQDIQALEKRFQHFAAKSLPFEKLDISKSDAMRMFSWNEFKTKFLTEKINDDENVSIYRVGPFIDLCRGPHIPHTGMLRGGVVLPKWSEVHWEGRSDGDKLQRIYGVAFPDAAQAQAWRQRREEAAKRDHRTIGQTQQLWHFHPQVPGHPFFLPPGTRIINRLLSFMRRQLDRYGFQEIMTPQMLPASVWQTSGHADHYAANMFHVSNADGPASLKPMNCPGHCLLFAATSRSYRELPLRWADFSPLHRNEVSGTLTGLTRLRRFHQDDGHIFCTEDQVETELVSCLRLVRQVYGVLGMETRLYLSTRPVDAVGDAPDWDAAEDTLRRALSRDSSTPGDHPGYEEKAGDGAFYGPKIDVGVRDALGREHQLATIQLDRQLPARFGLSYTDAHGERRPPVLIHRAVLGSVERFLAIATEHFGGRWPVWLSPRTIAVVPVAAAQHGEAARRLAERMERDLPNDASVDVHDSDATVGKRIRGAQTLQYNYILVVGDREASSFQESNGPGLLSVRMRDSGNVTENVPYQKFVEQITQEMEKPTQSL